MRTILFDFDDTLSDTEELNRQYLQVLSAGFAQEFGGDSEAWETHCGEVLSQLQTEFFDWFEANPTSDYLSWMSETYARSTTLLLEPWQVPIPENREAFAREGQARALRACSAIFEGVSEVLAFLKEEGYALHMASGQESDYLLAGLHRAELVAFPKLFFGPDLVNCAKTSPLYYERILNRLAVPAESVLVVDDLPEALEWAQSVGCKTLQAKLGSKANAPDVHGVQGILKDWTQMRDREIWHTLFS